MLSKHRVHFYPCLHLVPEDAQPNDKALIIGMAILIVSILYYLPFDFVSNNCASLRDATDVVIVVVGAGAGAGAGAVDTCI